MVLIWRPSCGARLPDSWFCSDQPDCRSDLHGCQSLKKKKNSLQVAEESLLLLLVSVHIGRHVLERRVTVFRFDSILYLEDDGFRPWPNLPTGPR